VSITPLRFFAYFFAKQVAIKHGTNGMKHDWQGVRNGERKNYSEKYEVNNGILFTIVLVFYLLPKK
jgi:hypothetical protein